MVSKMQLINYKCFPNTQIKFSDMTILAGANAAGKSSIIQALLLAYNSMNIQDKAIEVSKALGIQVGGPKSLVSQAPIELDCADFIIKLCDNKNWSTINYIIDKMAPLKLNFED